MEQKLIDAGLVLEGGGMKGMFTAGVLDAFLEEGLLFGHCYGVSAGACALISYISGQKGRTKKVWLDFQGDKRFCSFYSLVTTGDLFGARFNYDYIPHKLVPFDFEAFKAYRGEAYATVTNIKTGEAEYMRLTDMEKDLPVVRASASLPLISRNVRIGDGLYLDGGVSDCIPFAKSLADGNARNVVILTKPAGYVRKQAGMKLLYKLRYAKYPKVTEDMIELRHLNYNRTLKEIEAAEAAGEAFVIRPSGDITVKRIEKDTRVLAALYEEGYKLGHEKAAELRKFLAGGAHEER